MPLFFVQLVYICLCMVYLKYNIPSFYMVASSFSDQKIRKIC